MKIDFYNCISLSFWEEEYSSLDIKEDVIIITTMQGLQKKISLPGKIIFQDQQAPKLPDNQSSNLVKNVANQKEELRKIEVNHEEHKNMEVESEASKALDEAPSNNLESKFLTNKNTELISGNKIEICTSNSLSENTHPKFPFQKWKV